MKTNLIKKMMTIIVVVSASFMFQSFGAGSIIVGGQSGTCPDGPIPECPPIWSGASDMTGTFSAFFPHPNDCHWFFHCLNGVPYCIGCPADLHWNSELETCDYPNNAGCESGSSGGGSGGSWWEQGWEVIHELCSLSTTITAGTPGSIQQNINGTRTRCVKGGGSGSCTPLPCW